MTVHPVQAGPNTAILGGEPARAAASRAHARWLAYGCRGRRGRSAGEARDHEYADRDSHGYEHQAAEKPVHAKEPGEQRQDGNSLPLSITKSDYGHALRVCLRVVGMETTAIRERQNSAEMVFLLKAVAVSHQRAQRLDAVCQFLAVGLALAGLAATLVQPIALTVTLLGAAWAIAYSAGLGTWTRQELVRAATLQEMFDTRLYGLPWNEVAAAEPVSVAEVSRLANRYRGSVTVLTDYYEVPALPVPYDVIACQLQNLAWGARVRRRYAHTLLLAIVGWCAAGLLVGVLAKLTVVDVALRWYVPSLGALLLAWDSFQAQREVAAERERAMGIIRRRLVASANLDAEPESAAFYGLARNVQDLILRTRIRNIRVPNWFFTRFHQLDRVDFGVVVAELEATLRRGGVAFPG